MKFLLFLIGQSITTAAAKPLESWGSSNPGVQQMWQRIRGTLFTRSDPVYSTVGIVINFVYPLIGAAAMLVIIYAGIRIITAQGKEDVISNAKSMIMYALIGVVLGVISSTVIAYFANFFFPSLLGG
jgi:hypothetical protein